MAERPQETMTIRALFIMNYRWMKGTALDLLFQLVYLFATAYRVLFTFV